MVEFPIPSNCSSIFKFSSASVSVMSSLVFSVGGNVVEGNNDQYKIR